MVFTFLLKHKSLENDSDEKTFHHESFELVATDKNFPDYQSQEEINLSLFFLSRSPALRSRLFATNFVYSSSFKSGQIYQFTFKKATENDMQSLIISPGNLLKDLSEIKDVTATLSDFYYWPFCFIKTEFDIIFREQKILLAKQRAQEAIELEKNRPINEFKQLLYHFPNGYCPWGDPEREIIERMITEGCRDLNKIRQCADQHLANRRANEAAHLHNKIEELLSEVHTSVGLKEIMTNRSYNWIAQSSGELNSIFKKKLKGFINWTHTKEELEELASSYSWTIQHDSELTNLLKTRQQVNLPNRYALNTCQSNNCHTRIYNWDTYCANHTNSCANCSNRIASSQTYCSTHQEQNQLKSLVQQKLPTLSSPQEVTRFSTWWNNNLATIVNYNSGYWVFLVVYDKEKTNNSSQINWTKEVLVFPSNHTSSKWGQCVRQQHSSLTTAQSEASWLREALDSNNPILYVYPYVNSYTNFGNIITEPYVKSYSVGNSSFDGIFEGSFFELGEIRVNVPSSLDHYVKPLDIIKAEKRRADGKAKYYHYGIYLGRNQILDLGGDNQGAWILPYEKDKNFISGATSHITAYHSIIPFKHYKKIIEHVVKANSVHYGEGNYCLSSHNCEHCAWGIGIGVYFSGQADNRSSATSFWCDKFHGCASNSGRGNVCLKNEINETNNKFDNLTSCVNSEKARNLEARIEVPSQSDNNCRVM